VVCADARIARELGALDIGPKILIKIMKTCNRPESLNVGQNKYNFKKNFPKPILYQNPKINM
jgi:hypothetical protein